MPLGERIQFLFRPTGEHQDPFNQLVLSTLFSIFGFNYMSFLTISILMHFCVSILLLYLLRSIFPNNKLATFIGVCLFGVSSSSYQATMWVLANVSIHVSTSLCLLSLLFFVFYTKNLRRRHLVISLLLLLVSLFFKEIAIGIFIFYLIILFYMAKFKKHQIPTASIVFTFGVLLCYLLWRFLPTLSVSVHTNVSTNVSVFSNIKSLLYNLTTLPLKTLVHVFVSPQLIYGFSRTFSEHIPAQFRPELSTTAYDKFVLSVVFDLVSAFCLFLFVNVLTIILFFVKNAREYFNILGIYFLFIVLTTLVFIFAPERSGRIYYLESRHFYLPMIAASFLVTYLLVRLKSRLLFIIIIIFIFLNIVYTRQSIILTHQYSSTRRNIIEQISYLYPVLPQKVIFFVDSDSSYFGLAESVHILPFQSGFGQALMIQYSQTENLPSDFFTGKFLWSIDSQGYEEHDGRGFGYFRDFTELNYSLSKTKISPTSVIAFKWDSKRQELTDSTEIVQKQLLNNSSYE